ncbi:hypothetical protein QJS66_16670 [Kocuria rhizophila]|nr:hypothetical protein QJS66_16670 [Kocuria rhizophila]
MVHNQLTRTCVFDVEAGLVLRTLAPGVTEAEVAERPEATAGWISWTWPGFTAGGRQERDERTPMTS